MKAHCEHWKNHCAPIFLLNRLYILLCYIKNWETTPLLALHGWSDLDDFFGRPPWNFDSDEMLKKARLRARAKKIALRVYFLPKCASVFRSGNTWNFQGFISKARGTFEPKNLLALPPKTPKFGQKRALGGPKMGQKVCFAQFFKAD